MNQTPEQPAPSAPAGPPPGYAPPVFAPTGQAPFGVPAGQAGFGARPQKTRWRDLIFGWRSAVALFAAGVVLGGLGGAALTVVIDHAGNDNAPNINRFPGGFGRFQQYGGQPGSQSGQSGSQSGQSDGSGTAGGVLGGEAG